MLVELWRQRLRGESWNESWRIWAKRAWTLPTLGRLLSRRKVLKLKGCQIAPTTFLSPLSIRGEGSRLSIGNESFVGRAEIHLLDTVTIGDCVVINDGVKLLTGSHDLMCPHFSHLTRPIVVHDYAWVASESIVLPGVTIGRGAVVAAGSVVTRNVDAGDIVAGNPAKVIKSGRTINFDYRPYRLTAVTSAWLGKKDLR